MQSIHANLRFAKLAYRYFKLDALVNEGLFQHKEEGLKGNYAARKKMMISWICSTLGSLPQKNTGE